MRCVLTKRVKSRIDRNDGGHVDAGAGASGHESVGLADCLGKKDAGSGTMAGAVLIAVAAILLAVIAAGANVMLSISRAHTAADQGALAAASALRNSKGNPCAHSIVQVKVNRAVQEGCTVVGEDVTVKVSVVTSVPFVPHVNAVSRAGPADCD